ncbi:proteoglycan Cow-like isoform X2 [Centruroides sculpturatus]|uniref:proteoglycan Cow-like isoform X2 n=1 Tax=Centruroides sculpturatus TaxID=218467 RepID=UPI000C6E2469|nr:proteoglycan Cow-like isoform X2 [Centruroides sculpturatus]
MTKTWSKTKLKMIFGWIVILYVLCYRPVLGWTTFDHPKMHSWDFEFDEAEEEKENVDVSKSTKVSEVWTENNLCKNLQCKPHQTCVVRDSTVALCVNRKKLRSKEPKPVHKQSKEDELERNDNEWDDQDSGSDTCIPCPLATSDFVCGSDNLTYSSVCRLEFRNCMHKTLVVVACKGFCPCKAAKSDNDHHKEQKMKERWNHYINKYQNTINKQNKLSKQKQSEKEDKMSDVTVIGSESGFTEHQGKQNSVLTKVSPTVVKRGCSEDELKAMGDRLLDWFSVVMSDHRRGQSRRRSFRLSHTELPDCKPEVNWMFQHLDTDGDMKLSLQELYDLEHDDREYCLRPYLLDCDVDGDLVLSPHEWCSCFDKSQRPCAAALKQIPPGLIGGYYPKCDSDGYYVPTQCHPGTATCWCVDRHGVEFTNTRRRGRPDCEGLLRRGNQEKDDDMEEDAEEDQEGSADRPLDF